MGKYLYLNVGLWKIVLAERFSKGEREAEPAEKLLWGTFLL